MTQGRGAFGYKESRTKFLDKKEAISTLYTSHRLNQQMKCLDLKEGAVISFWLYMAMLRHVYFLICKIDYIISRSFYR